MGVEFEIWCDEHKEKVYVGKLSDREMVVKMILDEKIGPNSIRLLPEWVTTLIDSSRMWQIEEALKFKQRHLKCELFLYNDHMDIGDEQPGAYFPKVDYNKSLPRTEDFEKNLREKTYKYVETEKGPMYITNKYSLPYGYEKREDLIIKIPCRGPIKKLISKFHEVDAEWMGMTEYIEYIFVTEDERLFKAQQGLFGCFITKEKLEKEIEASTHSGLLSFEVIDL